MSIVDDFQTIKADLAKLEESKALRRKQPMNVQVEEGKPTDWTDINLYGYAASGGPYVPPENDLTCYHSQAFQNYLAYQRRYLSPFYQQVLANQPRC